MVDEFSGLRPHAPRRSSSETDARELLRQAVFAQRVASPDIQVEMIEPAPEEA